jgi:hypothetical protein
MRVSTGASIKYRQFESVRMAPLSELRKVSATAEPFMDAGVRVCPISRAGHTVELREYCPTMMVGGESRSLPVAPFAYDGDLWLPVEPVLSALGV